MFRELTEFYEPDCILHRDKQINEIKKIFENFKKFQYGSNALILGVTGSGKTTVINKILKEEDNHLFVSIADTKTSYKTLKILFDLSYNTEEKIIYEAISKLKQNPKILVIDEFNKCKDPQNLFNNLNTIYRQTGCPIIIISNKRTLIEEMPEDAKKTLLFDKIDFPSYNPDELFDIILSRLEKIRKEREINNIDEGSLKHICAIGGKEGSARIVLTITLKCLISNDFSTSAIRKQLKNLNEEDWRDFILKLSETEKNFLEVLLDVYIKNNGKVAASDLINKIPGIAPSRVSQLITSFNDYGIIKTETKNLGRGGGKFRTIKFSSDDVFDRLDRLLCYGGRICDSDS